VSYPPERLKGLKPYPKGVSGNPKGKPKALLTKDTVERIHQQMAQKTRAQLQAVIDNKDSTMLEITVASILIKAAQQGDANRLEQVLERAVGKVVTVTESKHEVETTNKEIVEGVPTEHLLALVSGDKK